MPALFSVNTLCNRSRSLKFPGQYKHQQTGLDLTHPTTSFNSSLCSKCSTKLILFPFLISAANPCHSFSASFILCMYACVIHRFCGVLSRPTDNSGHNGLVRNEAIHTVRRDGGVMSREERRAAGGRDDNCGLIRPIKRCQSLFNPKKTHN